MTASKPFIATRGIEILAVGVQFLPVRYKGKTLIQGQGNNPDIFPAVGLAIYVTQARRVTDETLIAAAKAVADQVAEDEIESGLLYPPQRNILQTEIATAERVSQVIFDRNLAGVKRPEDPRGVLASQLYKPEYSSVTPAR
jgi:malate dehydrogenase (oxaloacetate-decarboxylating)(NADP+)